MYLWFIGVLIYGWLDFVKPFQFIQIVQRKVIAQFTICNRLMTSSDYVIVLLSSCSAVCGLLVYSLSYIPHVSLLIAHVPSIPHTCFLLLSGWFIHLSISASKIIDIRIKAQECIIMDPSNESLQCYVKQLSCWLACVCFNTVCMFWFILFLTSSYR